jgi:hypothetical protein
VNLAIHSGSLADGAQLARQRLGLDSPHPLPGDAQPATDLLQREGTLPVDP